jgi:hypothetical protein
VERSSAVLFVADVIKKNDIQIFVDLMTQYYRVLRLLRDQSWVSPKLEEKSNYLLPPQITHDEIVVFVDETIDLSLRNNYLKKLLGQISAYNADISRSESKIEIIDESLILSVVAYAFVLDRLTSLMSEDYRFIDEMVSHLANQANAWEFFKQKRFFTFMKVRSIEAPFIRRVPKFFQTGSVPTAFASKALVVNVLEAVVVDLMRGNINNALSGLVLAFHPPGSRKINEKTGAGPTKFSQDGKNLSFSYPLSKDWADLYGLWNLSFCNFFPRWPFVSVKLLIPRVARYQDEPETYLYNRTLALYVHCYFSLFAASALAGDRKNPYNLDFHNEKLFSLMSSVSRKSGLEYLRKLEQVDPTRVNTLKLKAYEWVSKRLDARKV